MTQETYQAWLAGLRPGDRLIIGRSGWARSTYDLRTLHSRLDDGTLLVEVRRAKFLKFDAEGQELPGDPYNPASLFVPTPELLAAVEAARARLWLDSYPWLKQLTDTQVVAVRRTIEGYLCPGSEPPGGSHGDQA
jgi:hypothetical protein